MLNQKSYLFKALRALGLVSLLALSAPPALADVSATSVLSAQVSSDTAVSGSVNLPALTLTEGQAGDIPAGSLIWVLPAGYVFDTSAPADVTYGGNGLTGQSAVSYPDSTHFKVDVSSTSTAASSLTVGNVTPLKVKAASGSVFAATGNITLSSGSLTGLTSTSSFGSLSQVAGAANKLGFTLQPPVSIQTGSVFSATVAVQDQFGNTVVTDNSRAITLSTVTAANTSVAASSTLGGTTSVNDTAGLSSFTNLTYPTVDNIKLSATATSLTGSFSNAITVSTTTPTPTPTVTPTPTSTPSIFLRNGSLVKVEGSATIYMVVGGILRPFTTPAIFHAHGKKFVNIYVLTQAQFDQLTVGSPIGLKHEDGEDDDDHGIMIPPVFGTGSGTGNASSTPPNLSNLPDGTLVKVPGNPTVYMVSGGTLQPFTSLTVFKAWKKDLRNIKTIDMSQFNSLSIGSAVSLPDGILIKGSDSTVYVVRGGHKYGIPSMEALRKHGHSLSNLVQLSDGEVSSIQTAGLED